MMLSTDVIQNYLVSLEKISQLGNIDSVLSSFLRKDLSKSYNLCAKIEAGSFTSLRFHFFQENVKVNDLIAPLIAE